MYQRVLPANLILLMLAGSSLAADVDYVRDIKPLLQEKCAACHGALKQEADLRLDAGQFVHSSEVISVDQPEESELLGRVTSSDPDLRMPPEGAGSPLKPNQVRLLRDWIKAGAKYPEREDIPVGPDQHWAYQEPKKTIIPEAASGQLTTSPIDYFIDRQLANSDLHPVSPASREVVLRRLYLDLIGLPPTRQEIQSFVNDESPEAVGSIIDRLLDRPEYGERWGRHWMDVWRYSDWNGYKNQLRGSQRHIWRWRDWIIESLNADKGYDDMIVEMLAADEAYPVDRDRLRATGYLARSYHNSNRNIWLDATVEHSFKAFLGTTINCSRCHDHKYDPIPQSEYYAVRAIFEPHNVRTERVPGQSDMMKAGLVRAFDAKPEEPTYVYLAGNEKYPDKENPVTAAVPSFLSVPFEVHQVSLPNVAVFPALQSFIEQEELAAAQKRLQDAVEKQQSGSGDQSSIVVQISDQSVIAAEANLKSLQSRWAADKAKFSGDGTGESEELAQQAATAERTYAVEQALLTQLQKQQAVVKASDSDEKDAAKKKSTIEKAEKELAEASKKLEEARTALDKTDSKYTAVGKNYPKTSTGRRLAFARWITDSSNPLTARVAVNHIWMRHFGAPLVKNVFDFGLRSRRPVHADLLDWLAVELIEHDWSMKHIHRLIVSSKVYQRASSGDPALITVNSERDADNELYWRANVNRLEAEVVRDSMLHIAGQLDQTMGGPVVPFTDGEKSRRRSVYIQHAYEKQMTMLVMFDAAAPVECYKRSPSIIPQQALTLSNSPLSFDMSRTLAAKLTEEFSTDSTATDSEHGFVKAAYETVLGRQPSDEELTLSLTFLQQQAQRLAASDSLTAVGGTSKSTVAPSADPAQRARENLIHVLMNHNDFITVR